MPSITALTTTTIQMGKNITASVVTRVDMKSNTFSAIHRASFCFVFLSTYQPKLHAFIVIIYIIISQNDHCINPLSYTYLILEQPDLREAAGAGDKCVITRIIVNACQSLTLIIA